MLLCYKGRMDTLRFYAILAAASWAACGWLIQELVRARQEMKALKALNKSYERRILQLCSKWKRPETADYIAN